MRPCGSELGIAWDGEASCEAAGSASVVESDSMADSEAGGVVLPKQDSGEGVPSFVTTSLSASSSHEWPRLGADGTSSIIIQTRALADRLIPSMTPFVAGRVPTRTPIVGPVIAFVLSISSLSTAAPEVSVCVCAKTLSNNAPSLAPLTAPSSSRTRFGPIFACLPTSRLHCTRTRKVSVSTSVSPVDGLVYSFHSPVVCDSRRGMCQRPMRSTPRSPRPPTRCRSKP